MRALLFASTALVTFTIGTAPARSADRTWDNANASNVWSDALNWGGTKPIAGDNANIASVGTSPGGGGAAITLNSTEAADNVRIRSGNQVNAGAAANLTVSGTVAVDGANSQLNLSGSTISAGTTSVLNGGALSSSGVTSLNGAITAANTSTFTVTGGSLTGNDKLTIMDTAKVFVDGGNIAGLTTVTNRSTNSTGGIEITAGRALRATSVVNENGGNIVSSGTIDAAVNNNNGSKIGASGAVNGAVTNNNTATFTVAGALTGNSTFANTGTAQLAVTGGNYSGLTTVTNTSTLAGGGILISSGRTLTATTINNNTAGTIVLNGGNVAAAVNNNNASTIASSGSSTISGAVALANTSTLTVSGGTLSGTSTLSVADTAKLAVTGGNYTGLTTITNTSANGSGGIEISVSRTLSATTINNDGSGTIVANGTVIGALNINGGTVGGTGTLGNTTVNSGGTLAPGNSIGTITVQGNLTFNAGSTYAVEVSPTEADRANVTGTATLNGTVAATFATGTYLTRTYTIISAASRSGTFATLTTAGLPAGFTASLNYTSTEAQLVLTAVLGQTPQTGTSTLPSSSLPANQQSVANTLNSFFNNGGTLPPGFVTLFGLTGAALSNGLAQVSGPAPAGGSTSAAQLMTGFLSLTLSPYGGAPSSNPGALGYARAVGGSEILPKEAADAYAAIMPVKAKPAATFDRRWSVWGQGFGGYNKTDGNTTAGTSDTTSRAYGFATGADYRLSQSTTLGFALAGGETNWGLAQGLGGGRSDVFQIGGYASHRMGAAYVSGSVAYAWYGMRTDRTVTVAGTDVLRADFDAHSVGGRLEAGYRVATKLIAVTPYVAGQVQNFQTPSYTETAVSGSNQFALTYAARNVTTTRIEFGSWFDKLFALGNGDAVMLRGRAAWAHDEGNRGGISAAFQTLPGTGFIVNGAAPPRDLALVSAGSEYRLANGFSLAARFDGEFASTAQTYAGTGTIRYAW